MCSQFVRSVFAGYSKCVRHPKTICTSPVSNSGLITLAHVVSLIVNQFCHAFADGLTRDPVGAGIFASLTRDTSGSRLPANTSSRVPSMGLQAQLHPLLLLRARVFKFTLYLIGHFRTLCFTERGSVRNDNCCHISRVFL